VRVRFYEGSYGPTICLDVSTSAELTELCRVFARLARGRVHEQVLDGRTVGLSGLDSLILRLNEPRQTSAWARLGAKPIPNVVRVPGPRSGPSPAASSASFEWRNSKDGWWYCLSLARGLLEGGSDHRFQILSQPGSDDPHVELSWGE